MDELYILGVKLHPVGLEETLRIIEGFVREGCPRLVITLGTEMVMYSQRDPLSREIINSADLVVPDTVGILWAARRAGFRLQERVTGIDLIWRLLPLCEEKGWRVFLLGVKEGVAENAARSLREVFPHLKIVGIHHGYFPDEASPIEEIRSASPEILLIGMGFPRQEIWFWKNKERLAVPVGIGVGGILDILAGEVQRAPRWMIALGLEWFYRLLREPWRWRRMLVLPQFALQILLKGEKICEQ